MAEGEANAGAECGVYDRQALGEACARRTPSAQWRTKTAFGAVIGTGY